MALRRRLLRHVRTSDRLVAGFAHAAFELPALTCERRRAPRVGRVVVSFCTSMHVSAAIGLSRRSSCVCPTSSFKPRALTQKLHSTACLRKHLLISKTAKVLLDHPATSCTLGHLLCTCHGLKAREIPSYIKTAEAVPIAAARTCTCCSTSIMYIAWIGVALHLLLLLKPNDNSMLK